MRQQDIKLAKWLVKHEYLDKENAEKALKELKKVVKNQPEKTFANFLIDNSYLSKEEYLKVKAEIKEGKVSSSNKTTKSKDSLVEKKTVKKTQEFKGKNNKAEEQQSIPLDKSSPKADEEAEEPSIEEAEPLIETHVNCPECHHEVEKGTVECPICAASIPKVSKITCKVCGRRHKMGTENCSHCDANLRTGQAGRNTPRCPACQCVVMPNAAVCTQCGSDLIKVSEASVTLKSSLMFLFFLAYIGLGALLWSMKTRIEKRITEGQVEVEFIEEINDYFQGVFPEAPDGFNEDLGKAQKLLLEKAYELVKAQDWQGLYDYSLQEKQYADVNLLRFWALSLLKLKKYDQLIALQRARPHIKDIDEMAAEVRYRKAGQLYDRGEVTQAYLTIKEAVQLAPDIPEYTFSTGVYAYAEGHFEEAEALFKKVIQVEDAFPESHVFLSLIYKFKNKEMAKDELLKFKESLVDLDMYERVFKALER